VKTQPRSSGRAISYARVSTDTQADSGLGLEAQRAAVQATATRLGLTVVESFTDAGLSGALDLKDRPGLFAALDTLRRGDVLIAAKRDRLGRDVVAVAMLERLVARKGARIVSAAGEGTESDEASAVLQRRILDSFAEYERLIIGQRTRAALRAKRERGEVAGTVPFGYRLADDGRALLVEPAEQLILALIRELRAGGHTLRAIAEALNRRGFTTRRGTTWRHQYVAGLAAAA
jgi:DNA invertase Pin-like site-specific DNA recombinase